MIGDAAQQHDIGPRIDDAQAVDPPRHPDRQALPGEFVDQRHQPDFPTVMLRHSGRRSTPRSMGCVDRVFRLARSGPTVTTCACFIA